MNKTVEITKSVIFSSLDAYSTILFSNSWAIGLLILTATMIEPFTGVTGLLGAITAVIFSRLFGFDTWQSRSGIFAFNSMLVCLGIGYFYPLIQFNWMIYLPLVMIASLLTVIVYITFQSIFMNLFAIPSMSIAFSIVAVTFSFFYIRVGGYSFFGEQRSLLLDYTPQVGNFLIYYFQSVGSIFFQPNFMAGVIIAIALLLTSRIGFFLSLLGYGICALGMQFFTNIPMGAILYPGLNVVLIAITIGGVYLIPGKLSYLFAGIASILGIVIAFAIQTIFYNFSIPPYAFPFNITVFIFVYAMGRRLKNTNPYLVDFGIRTPEAALKYYHSHVKRFYQTGVPQFYLPFTGEWKITQGNNGAITHQLQWAYAWDFEIFNVDGSSCKSTGTRPEDYYCYGKPVLASADGWVSKIIDDVEDNPINEINTHDNWGNTVTIHHGAGIYTMYCHMRKGSIKVKEGDYVRRFERLGAVGNSGRSAVPHLHFNIQLGAEPGSSTMQANLVNFKSKNETQAKSFNFHAFNIPALSEQISPLIPVRNLQDILQLKVGDTCSLAVDGYGKKFVEKWHVSVNLWGSLYIESDKGANLEFSIFDGIYNTFQFTGNRETALYAFALLVTRFPYVDCKSMSWSDIPPYSIILNRWQENFLLFFSTLAPLVKLKNKTKSEFEKDTILLTSSLMCKILGGKPYGYTGEVSITKFKGIEAIVLTKNGDA